MTKLLKSILATLAAGYIGLSAADAMAKDREEDFWKDVPVQTRVEKIGKYEVPTKVQEASWSVPNDLCPPCGPGTAFRSRTLETPGAGVIFNVYRSLNGAVAKVDKFLGGVRSVDTRSSSAKLEDDIGAMALELGMPIVHGQRLDLERNPTAERFVDIVYDTNDDGKLSEREMKKGNEKLGYFIMDLVSSTVPSDGEYHVSRVVVDIDEFEKAFESYQRTPQKSGRVTHQDKLRALIDHMVKTDGEYGHSVTLGKGDSRVRAYVLNNPTATSIFHIEGSDGLEFVDSGNGLYNLNEERCFLDGKLDQVESDDYKRFPVKDGNGSSTKKVTPELQRQFEGLVDRAYQLLPTK